ncbi:HipA family kinase [Evansella tamaricis]|uniref:HipA-like kinase domain-containing protein n=1 Tax=Evansella tamaricis TaxID=2069301 RepID=A0ABS6JI52_9BACI|nr:HipA family kinase [Evansella tamaricis]MBU9713308.1 hypothetical protein [Evansella tamaricis]
MIHAIKHIKQMRKGRTEPQLMKCSNQKIYVVKPLNLMYKRSLVNEYISYRLGNLLNLPLPEYNIITISRSVLMASPLSEKNFRPGLWFGTIYKRNAKGFTADLAISCKNLDQLASMFIFDVWIHNRDRHKDHVLIDKNKLFLIDHDKAFTGRNWNGEKLIQQSRNANMKVNSHHKYLLHYSDKMNLYREIDRISKLKVTELQKVIHSIPKVGVLLKMIKEVYYIF